MDNALPNKDKFLIVKGSAGMGNRMLCAASGIIYGQLSNRKVVIDWTDGAYSENNNNAFCHYFNCPLVHESLEWQENDDIFPRVWKGHWDKSISWMLGRYDPDKFSSIFIHKKYSINPKYLDYPEDVVVLWYYTHRIHSLLPLLKETEYAGMSVEQVLRKVLSENMKLKEPIDKKVSDFFHASFKRPTVGIHIRQTDRTVKMENYLRYLRAVLDRVECPQLFLSTDNKEVERYIEDCFSLPVIRTPKWYPDKNQMMHLNQKCPDKYQNGLEALVDMYLLSKCDYLIYAGCSTFSWISSILSDAKPENIIDIQRTDLKVRFKRWFRYFVA